MFTKIKNFFNYPLTTKEIIKLLQEHMKNVCSGKSADINPEDLYLVEVKNVINGTDFVIVYEWDDLYWELTFDRDVSAYSRYVARERYEDSKKENFSSLKRMFLYASGNRFISVSVRGKNPDKLKLRRNAY